MEEQFKKVLFSKFAYILYGFIIFLFLFWIFCLNHIDINEIGIAYNSFNGNIIKQEQPGWYITSPWVKVISLSLLPQKVDIGSAAKVVNTKIVRFKVEGLDEFIRLQGFSYEMSSSFNNILTGYAFSGKSYSFLEILPNGGDENINLPPLNSK